MLELVKVPSELLRQKSEPVREVDSEIKALARELVYTKGFHVVEESCLSIPDKEFTLRRAKIVKVRGLTLDGVTGSFRGRDVLAQVFQHELNHLDGLLIDQAGEEVRGR